MKKHLSLRGTITWLIVVIFYGYDYLLQHTMPSVLILPIAHTLHMSFVRVADDMNVFFLVYAFAQLPAGYILDCFPLNKGIATGSLTIVIGATLMSLASPTLLSIGRMFIAIGSAFAANSALIATDIFFPTKYFPFLVGALNAFGFVLGSLGMLALSHQLQQHSWQTALQLIALSGLLLTVVLFVVLKPSTTSKIFLEKTSYGFALLFNKQLWLIAIFSALIVGSVMATFAESYSVILLQQVAHYSSMQAAEINSWIFFGCAIGAPTHGLIATWVKDIVVWLRYYVVTIFVVVVMIMTMLLMKQSIKILSTTYFLLGFFVISILWVYTLAKHLFHSKMHAQSFAFITMITMLAGFLIPKLFGLLIMEKGIGLGWLTHPMQGMIVILAAIILAFALSFSLKGNTHKGIQAEASMLDK